MTSLYCAFGGDSELGNGSIEHRFLAFWVMANNSVQDITAGEPLMNGVGFHEPDDCLHIDFPSGSNPWEQKLGW